jgi:hypothetical protein
MAGEAETKKDDDSELENISPPGLPMGRHMLTGAAPATQTVSRQSKAAKTE